MRETILLVGHGSRNPAGNREIESFADQLRERHADINIELCFIEFAKVLLDDGLERAAQNAERIIVVPLILNAAGHVKLEIPQHIAKVQENHPDKSFIYAPHLGACDPILAILKRRLKQAMGSQDMPDPKTTGVILLGRGSSDRIANGEVAKMARWLYEESEHELVEIAFTGITLPRLEQVVQRQVHLGMTQIIVLPYYLFTGTLIERIQRQMGHLAKQYPQVRFAHGDYFGFEPEIFELLDQRRQETADISASDELAHDHHHHHHHS